MKGHYLIGDGGTKRRVIINPKFIVAGPQQERYLHRYLYANYKAIEEKNVKLYQNSFIPIISQEIDNLDFYCIADPTFIPSIKYFYLASGHGGPEITTKPQFEIDGLAIKVRHVFGVKAVEYRSIFKNQGARPDHNMLYGNLSGKK